MKHLLTLLLVACQRNVVEDSEADADTDADSDADTDIGEGDVDTDTDTDTDTDSDTDSDTDTGSPPLLQELTGDPSQLKIIGAEPGDFAGVVLLEDLNGDGVLDVIVGSPNYTDRTHSKIHVVYGPITADVDLATITARIEGDATHCIGRQFGVGHFDDDPDWDIVTSDYCFTNGTGYDIGRVLTYSGLPTDPVLASDFAAEILPPDGARMSSFTYGNLIGDAKDDLVLQSSRSLSNTGTRGEIWIVDSPPVTQVLPVVGTIYGGPSAWDELFGEAMVVDTSDLDGDGYHDLYASTIWYDALDDGIVSFDGFVGAYPGPIDPAPGLNVDKAAGGLYGENRCANFGRSLALGDLDGDGVDDLLVTSPKGVANPGTDDCLTVPVQGYATPFGLPLGPLDSASAVPPTARIDGDGGPNYLAPIGDFNGDGFEDFILSDVISTVAQQISTVHVFLGPITTVVTLADADYRIEAGPYLVGGGVGGDVTGDGYADLLLTTSIWTDATDLRGAVFIVEGRP